MEVRTHFYLVKASQAYTELRDASAKIDNYVIIPRSCCYFLIPQVQVRFPS